MEGNAEETQSTSTAGGQYESPDEETNVRQGGRRPGVVSPGGRWNHVTSVQEELEPCRLQTETVHLRLLLPICAQWLSLCKPTRLPDTGAGITQWVGIGLPDTWGRAVGLGGRHLGQVTQVWHRTLGKGEGVVGYLLEGKEQNLKGYTCLLFTSFSAHISLLCLA